METHELNNPLASCYREIEEETGIAQSQISGLELLYILIRRSGDEIIHLFRRNHASELVEV